MTAIEVPGYPCIDGVHPMIARINFGARPVTGRGRFDVRHGRSPLAPIILRVLRMPRSGHDLPLTLTIEQRGDVDVWRRAFAGGRAFVTLQRRVWPPIERFGPFELSYADTATAGELILRSTSARVRIGPLAWTLPEALSPRDSVRVTADGTDRVRVRVAIALPIVGPLLEYEGVVEEAT